MIKYLLKIWKSLIRSESRLFFSQLKKEVKAAAASATSKEGEGDDEDKSGKEQTETISTSATSSVEKAPLNDKDARLVGKLHIVMVLLVISWIRWIS